MRDWGENDQLSIRPKHEFIWDIILLYFSWFLLSFFNLSYVVKLFYSGKFKVYNNL